MQSSDCFFPLYTLQRRLTSPGFAHNNARPLLFLLSIVQIAGRGKREKKKKKKILRFCFARLNVLPDVRPSFFPTTTTRGIGYRVFANQRGRRNEPAQTITGEIFARSEYSRARVYSPFVKRWISSALKEKFQAHPSLCRRSFDALAPTSRRKWITRSEASTNLLFSSLSLSLVTSRLLKVSPTVALKASDKKKSFGIMVIRYGL